MAWSGCPWGTAVSRATPRIRASASMRRTTAVADSTSPSVAATAMASRWLPMRWVMLRASCQAAALKGESSPAIRIRLNSRARALGDHQDVDGAVADDPGGNAAHQKPGQAGEAMAAHDDPVGLDLFDLLHDAVIGGGGWCAGGAPGPPPIRRPWSARPPGGSAPRPPGPPASPG